MLIKYRLYVRIIAIFLVSTLIRQDIAWAHPDQNKHNLAVPGLQNGYVQARLRSALVIEFLEKDIDPARMVLYKIFLKRRVLSEQFLGVKVDFTRHQSALVEAIIHLEEEGVTIRYYDPHAQLISRLHSDPKIFSAEVLEYKSINPWLTREVLVENRHSLQTQSSAEEAIEAAKRSAAARFSDMDYHPINNPNNEILPERISKCIRLLRAYRAIATMPHRAYNYAGKSLRELPLRKMIIRDDLLPNLSTIEKIVKMQLMERWGILGDEERNAQLMTIEQTHFDYLVVNRLVNEIDYGQLMVIEKLLNVELKRETTDDSLRDAITTVLPYVADPDETVSAAGGGYRVSGTGAARSSPGQSLSENAEQGRNAQNRYQEHLLSISHNSEDWAVAETEWAIDRLIFAPGGIQHAGLIDGEGRGIVRDEFGNRPHWIYVIRNTANGKVIYVGPDDVKTLFPEPERQERIIKLRGAKAGEISLRRDRVAKLLMFGVTGRIPEETVARLTGLIRKRAIGDESFSFIDEEYETLSEVWLSAHPDLPLESFINILTDMRLLLREIGRKRLSLVTDTEARRVRSAVEAIDEGRFPSAKDVSAIRGLHSRLLSIQNLLVAESASWARRQAVAVDAVQQARTPAYHANLWIANCLLAFFGSEEPAPLILDAGSNLSVLWSILEQSSNAASKDLAENIYDVERDAEIWAMAPNPRKVSADFSKLPEMTAISDPLLADLFTEPNKFSVIVSSFMLDQLTPEELRGALCNFQALLKRPPAVELSADTVASFPLLIIASPENSPIDGSAFGNALLRVGFTLINARFVEGNHLTADAEERIKLDGRGEDLQMVRDLSEKNFHVAVYAKTQDVSRAEITALHKDFFALRKGRSRKRSLNQDEDGSRRHDRLNTDLLFALDVVSTLKPEDFVVDQTHAVVTRHALLHYDQYAEFEPNLAILKHYRNLLSARQRRDLDRILATWDPRNSAFLAEDDVLFVLKAPAQITVKHAAAVAIYASLGRMLAHILKVELDQRYAVLARTARLTGRAVTQAAADRESSRAMREKRWKLSQLAAMEDEIRREHEDRSIFELERSGIPVRIAKIRKAVIDLIAERRRPNLAQVAERIGINPTALRSWAERTEVDLILLGVLIEEPVDTDRRIGEIKSAVTSLIAEGKTPNLARVAERIGIEPSNLRSWAERAEVDLTQYGVIIEEDVDRDERIAEIQRVVAELVADGKTPSVNAVAKKMGIRVNTLTRWAMREKIDLEDYGVIYITKARNIKKITDAVASIASEGGRPTPGEVERRAGFRIKKWARLANVNLAEYGVIMEADAMVEGAPDIAEPTSGIDGADTPGDEAKNELIAMVDTAVAALKAKGKERTGQNVARQIGKSKTGKPMTYKNLLVLSRYHGIDLRQHGVDLRDVNREERIASIQAAVADIIAKGGVPTTAAVAAWISDGQLSGKNLLKWARYQKINLAEYGVVLGRWTDQAIPRRENEVDDAPVQLIDLPAMDGLMVLDARMRSDALVKLQQGYKIYLSENLFMPADADRLRVVLDKDKIEIATPDIIRNIATNHEAEKGTIGCIVTRDDLKYWNSSAHKIANKAAILAIDIDQTEEARDRDFAYIYIQGLIGLVSAMTGPVKDRDVIVRYMELLFEKQSDPAMLDEYLNDDDSIKFALNVMLKLKLMDKMDIERLDRYKENTDTLLMAA